ncbi:hypothetical protein [Streptomyces ambofaciens]|nr:hypothetical protein [Streptomyces ambofaciens]
MVFQAMTLAERWDGPPWFRWAWLITAGVVAVFIFTMLARRGRRK